MATLQRKLTGEVNLCPTCMMPVGYYARLIGQYHWQIVEMCPCGHINNVIKWPFKEDPNITDVKPDEFLEHGVHLYIGRKNDS